MIKKLIIVMFILAAPLVLGLLITYQIIGVEWISFMELQPSYRAQEAPLPMPAGSVPIQGAAYVPGMGAPVNPVQPDEVSLQRGQQLYSVSCVPCHGAKADGKGPIAPFLKNKPANLLEGNAVTGSDGEFFLVVTTGIPGRMPPMIENLPEARDRWDVVNYVRSLQK